MRGTIREIPSILTLIDDPRRYDLRAENLCFISNNPPADQVIERVALILPAARRIGLIYDAERGALLARDLRRAAARLGLEVELRPTHGTRALPETLASLTDRIDVLLVPFDPLTVTPEVVGGLTRWALMQGLPMAAPGTEWVRRGALFSYGAPVAEIGQEAAWVAGQLLDQTRRPSDFDLRLPSRHVLAINETTALALGISFPSGLRVDVAFGAGPFAAP